MDSLTDYNKIRIAELALSIFGERLEEIDLNDCKKAIQVKKNYLTGVDDHIKAYRSIVKIEKKSSGDHPDYWYSACQKTLVEYQRLNLLKLVAYACQLKYYSRSHHLKCAEMLADIMSVTYAVTRAQKVDEYFAPDWRSAAYPGDRNEEWEEIYEDSYPRIIKYIGMAQKADVQSGHHNRIAYYGRPIK